MKYGIFWRISIMGLAVFTCSLMAGSLTGCSQQTLFSETRSSDDHLKYFGGDSAVQTREQRRATRQTGGWGFPTGNGLQ